MHSLERLRVLREKRQYLIRELEYVRSEIRSIAGTPRISPVRTWVNTLPSGSQVTVTGLMRRFPDVSNNNLHALACAMERAGVLVREGKSKWRVES